MTREEAVEVTGMVVNHWATPRWTQGQMEAFVEGISDMDADLAVEAVALASKELQHRPVLAEMYAYYRLARTNRKMREPETQGRMDKPPKATDLPAWVKRWVCARMLADRMGREQDMRPFVEQLGPDYPPDLEVMPAHEWEDEAARITDAQALSAILGRT